MVCFFFFFLPEAIFRRHVKLTFRAVALRPMQISTGNVRLWGLISWYKWQRTTDLCGSKSQIDRFMHWLEIGVSSWSKKS